MCFEISDLQIIQFIDYGDEEWSCEHINRYADGLEAVVGPAGIVVILISAGWCIDAGERRSKWLGSGSPLRFA